LPLLLAELDKNISYLPTNQQEEVLESGPLPPASSVHPTPFRTPNLPHTS
jgi:hypothetical protein